MNSEPVSVVGLPQDQPDWIRQLLSRSPAMVVILDEQGRIRGFNAASERATGWTWADVEGQSFRQFLLPEDQQWFDQHWQLWLRGQPGQPFQATWLSKDQGGRVITWSPTLAKPTDQRPLIIAMGLDVSHQHQSAHDLQQQIKHEQLLSAIAARIRQSLDLHTILNTTVAEVRQLLQTDRVLILRFVDNWQGSVLVESVSSEQWSSLLGTKIYDPCFQQIFGNASAPIGTSTIENVHTAQITPCHLELLIQFQVQANLVVPILQKDQLWGLLVAHHCRSPRHWDALEVNLLNRLATQLAIALQQAELYRHLQTELSEREQVEVVLQEARNDLEQKVSERTAELQTVNHQLWSELQTRQAAETALKRSQERLSGILEIAEDAIISVDADQRITLFNQGAEKLFGYSAAAVLGQPLDLLLPPEQVKAHQQHVQQYGQSYVAARTMTERRRPIFGRRQDGSYFPAEASISKLDLGEEQVYTAILRDISDRVAAQQALEKLTQQNKLILDSMGEGLLRLDLQACFTYVNPVAAEILRYPIVDLIGRSITSILVNDSDQIEFNHHPIDPPPLFFSSLIEGATHRFITDSFRRRDGSTVPIEYVSTPIHEDGQIVGAVLTFKDISDRQVVDRMKDDFIAIVSHELRTPLTSIHGSLRMLTSGLLKAQPTKSQRLLQIAEESTDRLIRLINDILDMERIESNQVKMIKQCCDIGALMLQATDTMQGMAEEKGIFLTVVPLTMHLWVDPDRILQTLTNLLSNAIKFSEPGGQVSLTAIPERQSEVAMPQTHGPSARSDLQPDAGYDQVRLLVQDQGRGIKPDKLETIFERFQQADSSDARNQDGTGLGLSICRSIVYQHEGEIGVTSQPEQGSTFYFTLPLKDVQSCPMR